MSRSFPFVPLVGLLPFLLAPLCAQQPPPPAPVITPDTSPPEAYPEPEITLDELVCLALANNPQLPIAREALEAARQRL